jgi:hypothetical protein
MATPDVLRCPRCFPSEAPAGIVRPAHAPDRPVEIELAGPQRWHSVPRSSPSNRLADMSDMLGFMPSLAGDRNQIDAQTLIDQKPHATSIDASFRRRL